MTTIATPIPCHPTDGRAAHALPRLAATTSTTGRHRTVRSGLRDAALTVWRLLPALSSTTPSDDLVSALSHSDRLGERR